jgi:hypothetical protein
VECAEHLTSIRPCKGTCSAVVHSVEFVSGLF